MSFVVGQYVCYMLQSTVEPRYTYIGCTNNPRQRLRRHNGELVNGAKATRAHRPWRMVRLVTGFETKREALRFEWCWKHWKKSVRVRACLAYVAEAAITMSSSSSPPKKQNADGRYRIVHFMVQHPRVWIKTPGARLHIVNDPLGVEIR